MSCRDVWLFSACMQGRERKLEGCIAVSAFKGSLAGIDSFPALLTRNGTRAASLKILGLLAFLDAFSLLIYTALPARCHQLSLISSSLGAAYASQGCFLTYVHEEDSVVFGPTGFVCTKHALHIAGGSGGVRLIALQEMCKDSSNCCRL
eukprot:1156004-Pelagomonas_calceolata.AAC.6